jgi:hypothetical protein
MCGGHGRVAAGKESGRSGILGVLEWQAAKMKMAAALTRGRERSAPVMTSGSGKRSHLSSSPFKPPPEGPPVERFDLNDLVTHDKYGLGRVILVESDTAVVVDFSPMKVRITAPFARMSRL